MDMKLIDAYISENLDQSVEELSRLCAQPSVAAQNLGIEECANLVSESLKARGFDVQILPTGGSPVVFGERKGKADKTLLVYDHYDWSMTIMTCSRLSRLNSGKRQLLNPHCEMAGCMHEVSRIIKAISWDVCMPWTRF